MSRHIALVFAAGLVVAAGLNAGTVQIQLGQTSGGVNDGLTTTYMQSGVGATNTASLKNYDAFMYLGSTENGTPPTPFAGYSNTLGTASTAGSTIMDPTSLITFDMVSQANNYGNFWELIGATPTVTIPVGVFGVKTVWTMLNNAYGVNAVNNTDVTFTFDNAADGSDAGSLNTVTLDLVNGTEIRDAIDCTNAQASCTNLTFATGLAASTSVPTIVTGTGPASVTVVTHSNIYSSLYNGGTSAPYAGTSGNLVLDDQSFGFGSAFASQYLVSIKITDSSGVAGVSRTGISAVTLIANAPEPGSVFLLVSGLGILGFGLMRQRRVQN